MAGLGEPQATADAGLMTETRRFPPPGQIDETEACFIVRDPCCGQQRRGARRSGPATFLAPVR